MFGLFNSDNAFPSTAFISHDMKVYDLINLPGSWSVNNRIQSMLEECGSTCDSDSDPCSNVSNGDLNNDDITNIGDIMMTISYILYNSELDCLPDVNQDGIVNVSDITSIVNIILN